MNKQEIADHIGNKSEAKITVIKTKLNDLNNQEPYSAYTREMIDSQISFYKKELTIWNKIMLLNELYGRK
jgi:hypothetical protein